MQKVLKNTLDSDTKRNVTVLLYANELEVPEHIKPTFQDLSDWKENQTFKTAGNY